VGRGRSFVQSTLTTQTVLGLIGEELIDICSQHEHHFLTHPAKHLDVLDAGTPLLQRITEQGAPLLSAKNQYPFAGNLVQVWRRQQAFGIVTVSRDNMRFHAKPLQRLPTALAYHAQLQ